jgi:signal transduction histidine kinase
LTASRMDIAWVRQHLTPEQSSLAGKLSRALEHLDQGIYLKRCIIENLRPTTLTTIGFTVAAQDLAQQMGTQSGWHLELQFPEKDLELSQDIAISLFRILQESLTNIVKHACASVVRICMECDVGLVKLEIEDNGIGFRNGSDEVNSKMTGLLGMRQRVAAYGGLFEIKSRLKQGTLVRVIIYPEKHRRNAPLEPL